MTVKELIKQLQEVDGNLEVFVNLNGGEPSKESYPKGWNMPKKWIEIVGK